jgi:hypothetical protein
MRSDIFGVECDAYEIRLGPVRRGRAHPYTTRIVVLVRVEDGAIFAKVVRGDGRNGTLTELVPEQELTQQELEELAERMLAGEWSQDLREAVAHARAAKQERMVSA